MKNILIPTDFSANAWKATVYAFSLFQNELCNFYFLNACKPEFYTPDINGNSLAQAKSENEISMKKLLKEVAIINKNQNHRFKSIIIESWLDDAVIEIQKEIIFDLIIMGTKGETEPDDRIFGTNSMNVIESVDHMPVLLIPDNCVYVPEVKKELVLATRYDKSFSDYEINFLIDMAKKFKASIRILYIQDTENLTEEQKNTKEELHDYFKEVSHSFHTLTNIKVTKGIHSFIESRNSDVLVLNHKKRGFFENLFSKSLLKELGKKPQIPMLFMPSDL
ncbi:universal stress protein [Salegentibacter salegens]|uniref:Nucleotide-binding universal stress protein, UspA family n=1 Tax=Salegentibacter salegens TaxID=143223 RepID=A0A1M7HGE8_9FLAO|nr:universal stress protein [Salegentibacter salegens]PRX44078.1 nucleotide-binding universal stress UspA family protein [Salegentibacter salegens]SHM27611.1 Nucleotide-binding universal stress protein, UspA family [Salegentibacter salegens]